jgi:site-specific DNA recombinase
MLVFPYIRVSTIEQAKEGLSIGTQKKRLTAFAQSQDWDIYDFYIDDGKSAKDTKRDDLQRLLTDIKKVDKENKVVLTLKLDRLTRSVRDLYDLLQTFEEHNTAFRSASEVFDTTTAMGRLFITIVAAMAQWERENTSERVVMNMEELVMKGRWHGSTPPIGFDYDTESKELYKNKKEATLVRLMFKMYMKGFGTRKLAIWLNNRGYTTKGGDSWTLSSVLYVLKNPIYIQILRWNFTTNGEYMEVKTNSVPRIMDDETFYLVQKLIKEKGEMHPRRANSTYIFTGKLRCSRCGSGMATQIRHTKSRTYRYYKCVKRSIDQCDLPGLEEKLVEAQFLREMQFLSEDSAALEVAASVEKEEQEDDNIKLIQYELNRINQRRKKWQLAYADEVITLDDLRERTKEDKLREEELRSQLKHLSDNNEAVPFGKMRPDEIAEILKDFDTQWCQGDRKEKKTMVQLLIETITLDSPHDLNKKRNQRKIGNSFDNNKISIKEIKFK